MDENEFLLISIWLYLFISCYNCDALKADDLSLKMNLQTHHVSGSGLNTWIQQASCPTQLILCNRTKVHLFSMTYEPSISSAFLFVIATNGNNILSYMTFTLD